MLTFEGFAGINNVLPEQRMKASDLVLATDVDIGLSREVVRRTGTTQLSDDCHRNLWQAPSYLVATCGSTLTGIWPDGSRHALHPSMGPGRVRYCDLPDGRTVFSSGGYIGVTDGRSAVPLTPPTPPRLGAAAPLHGALHPGSYRYHLTYARQDDLTEGPAISSEPIDIQQGGLRLDGLPDRPGHSINVYLSSMDGEGAYLAGATAGRSFEFAEGNHTLVLPCRTLGATPTTAGTFMAFWRGCLLVAEGSVLWASRPGVPHLTDWRNFKPLVGNITAVQPVDDGIYVGTDRGLIWLGGTSWDALTYSDTQRGPVVPGSGVAVRGDRIRVGDGAGNGSAMLCIAGGEIVAGFGGGQTSSLTGGRYRTNATEVCATFREVRGIPQYVAVPQ